MAHLGRHGPSTLDELLVEVNVRRTRLDAMLKVLEVEGAVERAGRGWACTGQPWVYDAHRVAAVTAVRREEQAQMAAYALGPSGPAERGHLGPSGPAERGHLGPSGPAEPEQPVPSGATGGCRMAFLCGLLDDPDRSACGACDRCTGTSLGVVPAPEVVAAAARHLRRRPIVLVPKKQWIGTTRTRIPPGEQAEVGAALCELSDGGWGRLVAEGRRSGRIADEVVEAAADLARSRFDRPCAAWVAWVPSLRRPALVTDLAGGIAARLSLTAFPAVVKLREAPPQGSAANSAQQLANVRDVFGIEGPLPPGPALLVDDTVQSGWTLTVAAAALRRAGCPAVLPLVLARARG